MISICLLRQLKIQLLSSHQPHKFAQTDSSCERNWEIAVLSNCYHFTRQQAGLKSQPPTKIGKLHDDLAFYEERHGY